jgi:REP element-mobilizing transposase RayT
MKKMTHSEHLVLRARLPLLRIKKNKTLISQLLFCTSKRFNVRIYNNSLNSNHIHLLVKAQTPKDLHDFIRVFAGQVAQQITGAVRGKKNKKSFWIKPVWKRLVSWGKDFLNLHSYIYRNQLETLGLIPYKPRHSTPPFKVTR